MSMPTVLINAFSYCIYLWAANNQSDSTTASHFLCGCVDEVEKSTIIGPIEIVGTNIDALDHQSRLLERVSIQ